MNPSPINENKEAIILEMKNAYAGIVEYIESLDESMFTFSPDHRWSPSGQLEHLILSSKGVASVLKMSKFKLGLMGKAKNGSKTYEDLFGQYKDVLSTGVKASAKFSPDPNKSWKREELLDNWKMIGRKFEERIPNWSEKDLDIYQIPHPAIGKITLREMLFFTVFHTGHHLKTMKALFEKL